MHVPCGYNGGMDTRTARILNRATGDFYRRHASSFSATRHTAWPGWKRLMQGPAGHALPSRGEADVLDVACGNLRFERFLRDSRPDVRWRFHAVDSCPLLVGEPPADVAFCEFDILDALLADGSAEFPDAPACHLAACFGFFHHVPGHANRVALLRALAASVAPGGAVAVSFWQFLKSPQLADRAQESHVRGLEALAATGIDPAQLEAGDYLLGWQDAQDAFRYCHSFDAAELDALLRDAGLADALADRFECDGRTGDLNAYIVLRM